MSYKPVTFRLYNAYFELAQIAVTTFDITRYRLGLKQILDEINSILRETFNIDVDVTYPDDIKEVIEEQTASIPEESVPWWLKEVYWVKLQESFLKPLQLYMDGGGGEIYSTGNDPYIPGVSLQAGDTRIEIERRRASEVASAGTFRVVVRGRASDELTVPTNTYYERVYPNFIVDIDSLVDSGRDTIQWAGKILAWMRLPTVSMGRPIQNVQPPKSWHGVDPVHINVVSQGGFFNVPYGLEITINNPKDSNKVRFVFRNINNYTDEQGRAEVELQKGANTLVIRGSGFLSPLPSFQMSIYPQDTVKIESVRLMNLWEVIRSMLGF